MPPGSLGVSKKLLGKSWCIQGPVYESSQVEGNHIRVRFQQREGGLAAKEGKSLTHFEIAGADEKFVPATAAIDGATILVSSELGGKNRVAVRFAWSDTAEPNLFNQEGLPASPFRTDNFKMATAGNVK